MYIREKRKLFQIHEQVLLPFMSVTDNVCSLCLGIRINIRCFANIYNLTFFTWPTIFCNSFKEAKMWVAERYPLSLSHVQQPASYLTLLDEQSKKINGRSPLCLGLTHPCLMSSDKETWPTSAPKLSNHSLKENTTHLSNCYYNQDLHWSWWLKNRLTPKTSASPSRLPTHWAYL